MKLLCSGVWTILLFQELVYGVFTFFSNLQWIKQTKFLPLKKIDLCGIFVFFNLRIVIKENLRLLLLDTDVNFLKLFGNLQSLIDILRIGGFGANLPTSSRSSDLWCNDLTTSSLSQSMSSSTCKLHRAWNLASMLMISNKTLLLQIYA